MTWWHWKPSYPSCGNCYTARGLGETAMAMASRTTWIISLMIRREVNVYSIFLRIMASKFKLLTPFWLLALLLIFNTCQKEDGLDVSMTLTAFSIESETKPAIIDDQSKTITVHVSDMMDWTNLSIRFNNGNNTRLVYMEEGGGRSRVARGARSLFYWAALCQ